LNNQPVFLLIGDVATLHDLGAISMALQASPGNSSATRSNSPLSLGNLKIICVNNSGGGIFSFLPIKNHADLFSPYFDTPHGLRFAGIVDAMKSGAAVAVGSLEELSAALANSDIKFIECVDLPDHETNVRLHKQIGAAVAHAVRESFSE